MVTMDMDHCALKNYYVLMLVLYNDKLQKIPCSLINVIRATLLFPHTRNRVFDERHCKM